MVTIQTHWCFTCTKNFHQMKRVNKEISCSRHSSTRLLTPLTYLLYLHISVWRSTGQTTALLVPCCKRYIKELYFWCHNLDLWRHKSLRFWRVFCNSTQNNSKKIWWREIIISVMLFIKLEVKWWTIFDFFVLFFST